MWKPDVSVITPTYNRSTRICSTLHSVLCQTFRSFEYIVVDDGSTDDTADVVRALARDDKRLRYEWKPNGGGASARSYGLRMASGKFIAFLDHDDQWVEDKLELQMSWLLQQPDYGWVYGRLELIDEAGELVGSPRWSYYDGWVQRQFLIYLNFIGTYSNPLMRRSVLDLAGMPDSSVGIADDWDLFIRLAGLSQVGFMDRVLVRYNMGNVASQSRDIDALIDSVARVLRKHRHLVAQLAPWDRLLLEKRMLYWRAECKRVAAYLAQADGDAGTAARWYLAAARIDPTVVLRGRVLKDIAALVKGRIRRG